MVALNIGELARQAGLQTSAIRYYESIGLMPPPPRASGWRRYDPAAIDRLQVIKAARDVGFTVADISQLLNGFPQRTPPSQRWRTLAERKLPEIEELIARASALKQLLQHGLDCTCEDIAVCISSRGDACAPAAEIEAPAVDACSGECD